MSTQRNDQWSMVAHPRVRVQYVECSGIEVHEREMTDEEAMLFALLTKKHPHLAIKPAQPDGRQRGGGSAAA